MKFNYALENFRGLAIVFVMLSHLSTLEGMGVAGRYLKFVVVDATSWFVFLSGFLFAHIEGSRFRYSEYIAKKLKYVMLPYLIMVIPVISLGIYFGQEKLIGLSRPSFIAWSLLVGGYVVSPLWFMPMIFIFFLLSPLFHRVAKSKVIYVLAAVGMIFTLFSSRPVANLNPFLSFAHFAGFYLLGMACSAGGEYIEKIKISGVTWIYIALGVSVFSISTWLYGVPPTNAFGYYENLGRLNVSQLGKMGLLIAIFLFFQKYLDRKIKFLGYLAQLSFGLFFIHGFFVVLFFRVGYFYVQPNLILKFWIEVLVVIGLSLVTVSGIKLILKNRSRFVIGC
jgi:hypothetical protein